MRAFAFSLSVIITLAIARTALGNDGVQLDVGKFRTCQPASACNFECAVSVECTVKVDERECKRHTILGSINDPMCEATKAAQNALFANQKATCEAQKVSLKASCEVKKANCRAEADICASLRDAEIANGREEEQHLQALFDAAAKLSSEPFPREKIPLEGDFGLPPGFEIRLSTVDPGAFSAFQWGPFASAAGQPPIQVLAAKDRLISLEKSPSDWRQVARALIWVGFIQKLGIDGVAQALKSSPGTLEHAAESELARLCSGKC